MWFPKLIIVLKKKSRKSIAKICNCENIGHDLHTTRPSYVSCKMKVGIGVILRGLLLVVFVFLQDARCAGFGLLSPAQLARVQSQVGAEETARRLGISESELSSNVARPASGGNPLGGVRPGMQLTPAQAYALTQAARRQSQQQMQQQPMQSASGTSSGGGGGAPSANIQTVPSSGGGAPPGGGSNGGIRPVPGVASGGGATGAAPSGNSRPVASSGGAYPVAMPNVGGRPDDFSVIASVTGPEGSLEWTEWRPCNATCGAGYQERTRQQPGMSTGEIEWKECVSMDCDDSYLDYNADYNAYLAMAEMSEQECKGSSPVTVVFGALIGILLTVGVLGIYFLVVKIIAWKKGQKEDLSEGGGGGGDRGPLPPTPDEKGKGKPSKISRFKSKRKGSSKSSKPEKIKSVKSKRVESGTDDSDKEGVTSDEEENPYLDPSEINAPVAVTGAGRQYLPQERRPTLKPISSDEEIDLLGEPPPPPSKPSYEDEDEPQEEPDYIEFEG